MAIEDEDNEYLTEDQLAENEEMEEDEVANEMLKMIIFASKKGYKSRRKFIVEEDDDCVLRVKFQDDGRTFRVSLSAEVEY
ncbi:MAG: hypothetical protein WBX00_16635 [Isosphaeraceae bacterium]